MTAVLDTTILIDHLSGISSAAELIHAASQPHISVITWIEVMVGAQTQEEKLALKHYLEGFAVVFVNTQLAEKTAEIRKQYKLKLPDAIILATAMQLNVPLLTRNTKDFTRINHPLIHIPYYIN